jgi:diguanylate cyclase (GGDEF)-like protein/PAS domain S-box-containing protein
MRTLPRAAQLFVVAVVLSGGVLLVLSLGLANFNRVPLLIALVVSAMVCARLKLRLPTTKNRSTMSVSSAVMFTSLLLLGPHPTMVVAVAGAWCQSTFGTRNPNRLYQTLFNISSLLLAVQAFGLVYRLTGGTVGQVVWPDVATPLGAATLAYFFVNVGAVAVVVALSTRERITYVWHHDFVWGAPSYFVAAGAAVLAAAAIDRSAYAFMPLALTPIYVTYRTYQAYAGRLEDERRHREIIESLNEGMFVLTQAGVVELWNDAMERITRIGRQDVLNRELFKAVPAFRNASISPAITSTLQGTSASELRRVEFIADGTRRILHVRLLPFAGGLTGFVNDITDRTAAEEALRISEERYALALAGANDGIWDWDLTDDLMYFSQRWKAMLGLSPEETTTSPMEWFARVHADDIGSLKSAIAAHCAEDSGHFEHEHRVCHGDGKYRWMLCRGVAVRDGDGRVVRMAGSLTDVTERHLAQEQLRQAALHDPLTRLPNRALFMEMLEHVLAQSKRYGDRLFGTLFIDVDRFKAVNDRLGHMIGDQLLIAVTKRLQTCIRSGDVIARLGGDEFTVLLNELRHPGEVVLTASRIKESFTKPFELDGNEIFVTASIGVALSSTGYTRAEEILRDADAAMYRAKTLGRNRQEIFDVSMRAPAMDRLNLENDIRLGVERGEFHLCYQPIVSLATEQLVSFEALLRWKRRDGRVMMPTEFIPLAEEAGLIDLVGLWSLREASRQLAAWTHRFPAASQLGITVNVSSRQLMHPEFIEHVASAVHDAGIRPNNLCLEITETTLIHSLDIAATVLGELRALGLQVYLDDFGSGYSSLSYLHRFPVNALKIDRSFISSLADKHGQPAIVESIVALARSVGANVIAEGVETRDQLTRLRQIGCGYAQGFLFSEALAPTAAETLIVRDPIFSAHVAESRPTRRIANVH